MAGGWRRAVRAPLAAFVRGWERLRSWRRISFTRGGAAFTVGAMAVGFAAVNTGNNLLYLLLGAMLGLVALSGWLSERVLRGIEVERRVPHGLPAGRDGRVVYRVRNRKRRFPSLSLEIEDRGLPGRVFLPRVAAGGTELATATVGFERRGVRRLGPVILSTAFPFGFFEKSGDMELPGELVVWPRTDRSLHQASAGDGDGHGARPWQLPSGPRGEYRGLREYRIGDDPRDIHWRTTARRDRPVVREYDRDAARTLWICLDRGAEPGDEAEDTVELAASLAARASGEGRRFGLVAGERLLRPGSGPAHLEAVLDALARVEFHPAAPPPAPPAEPEACVLVSVHGRGRERFGAALVGSSLPQGAAGDRPVGGRGSRPGRKAPAEPAGTAGR